MTASKTSAALTVTLPSDTEILLTRVFDAPRSLDAGIDVTELAAKLQTTQRGRSWRRGMIWAWNDLLERTSAQRTALT
jgi:hypothetical protein